MKVIVSSVGWLLLLTTLFFYGYSIFTAIDLSWPLGPGKAELPFNPVLATALGSIQALLLANLGMLLGISIVKPDSQVARALKLRKGQAGVDQAPLPPMELKEQIQLGAMVIYIISLIACSITWVTNDFSENPNEVVPIISESGKLFLGVIMAYITAVLSK
jgi:hypothetical protein